MSKALSTRIMTAILRFVGMYLILACRDRAVWNLYLALIRDLRFTAWIRDIIATRSLIAHRQKQQIPPLRCAPVGMTDCVNYFRGKTLI